MAAQKAAGINPYPHKFFVTLSITEYIEKYGVLNNGDHLEDVQVSLAGRECQFHKIGVIGGLIISEFVNASLFCLLREDYEQACVVFQAFLL